MIFALLFLATTSMHIFQASKYRTYYFIPLILGGMCELGGYVGRALAHSNQKSLGIFIAQTILLLVSPVLFSASIYMVLGRLIRFMGADHLSLIRPKLLTKIFVGGDIVAFLIQTLGGSMMSKSSTQTNGKHLIVIGLMAQIFFFGFFVITAGVFHYRVHNAPTPRSLATPWLKYIYVLYSASGLILFRSSFRVVEFVSGVNSTLSLHEIYLYLFDAFLMVGVLASFNLVHPGHIINKDTMQDEIPLSRGVYDSGESGTNTPRPYSAK